MTNTITNQNADWLQKARYGAFMHFLPGSPEGLALVDKFDTEALAKQLQSMGVKYFVITLGQNSGYFNSPNAAYDRFTGYAPGERCSRRDLPMDLYKALHPRGIRLMLYLPAQTPNGDVRAQKAFGLPEGPKDQPIDVTFAKKWAEVIREWSDRYKDRVSGWWFDGSYEWVHFNDDIARIYSEAVKHGNPHAITAFNPGVKVIHYSKYDDYTAGELNDPLEIVPSSRALGGAQWHALTYLGQGWGQRNTRYSDAQWSEWVTSVAAHGGAVTLDMGPNYDPAGGPIGTLSAAQVEQVQAIHRSVMAADKEALP